MRVFADALKKSRVVLGESGLPSRGTTRSGAAADRHRDTGRDPRPFLLNFPGLLRNVPVLEQAGGGRGLFTIRTERDGIVRRVPMVMQAQGTVMPALTLDMLRVATGAGTILINSDAAGVRSVRISGL